MKPLIGITTECLNDPDDARTGGHIKLSWNYTQVVVDAGGVPVIVPPNADTEVLAGVLDGWLISGGNDIHAEQFGEENHPEVQLGDPARYEGEKRLFHAADPEMPMLGICYGCQFINVVRGGSLIQHLPDVVGHTRDTGGTPQELRLDVASKLREAMGVDEVCGKSYHHQAVKRLGSGLRIVAHNDDGTIEGIEGTDRPWLLGVQWHPERTQEDPATRRLFDEFIAAAARFAERRRMIPA